MQSTLRAALLAASLGAAVACVTATVILPGWAEDAARAVSIDNFTFTPSQMTVKAGTTVTWTNKDDIPHTVAASNKTFKSKTLDTDDSFSFTFTTPGTYEYFCSLHPHMKASIVVQAATGSNATP